MVLRPWCQNRIFKLRLGALIPRSVGRSVCRSVCRSVGLSVLQKLQKNYKTLQNLPKRYKTLQNIEIRCFCTPPPFQKRRPSRKLRQYAGASLTESSFLVIYNTFFGFTFDIESLRGAFVPKNWPARVGWSYVWNNSDILFTPLTQRK